MKGLKNRDGYMSSEYVVRGTSRSQLTQANDQRVRTLKFDSLLVLKLAVGPISRTEAELIAVELEINVREV